MPPAGPPPNYHYRQPPSSGASKAVVLWAVTALILLFTGAIEVLTKNEELAIKHLPPLYSTPTIGRERGEKT